MDGHIVDNESSDSTQSTNDDWLKDVLLFLYREIPIKNDSGYNSYFTVPRAIGACPECGAGVDARIVDENPNGLYVSIGFRCSNKHRPHRYLDEIWLPCQQDLGGVINQLRLFKQNDIPIDRDLTLEERKRVGEILKRMQQDSTSEDVE